MLLVLKLIPDVVLEMYVTESLPRWILYVTQFPIVAASYGHRTKVCSYHRPHAAINVYTPAAK